MYTLIGFLASRISSSSSFQKKGTQVLDILSYCLLKNVCLLLLYFLFEGILVEYFYFPFRTFELSVYCFRALIVLLCINPSSTFFFFLLGCWFDISFLTICFELQVTNREIHNTQNKYLCSPHPGQEIECYQHSTLSSWDLQNFHNTSGFSWRAYLRISLAFPRSCGMTSFSTLFTFHLAHF